MRIFSFLLGSTILVSAAFTGAELRAEATFSPSCFVADAKPVLASNDLFAGATWNDPSVLYENGQFVMYASADHAFDQKIEIYRLISADGRRWALSPEQPVLSPSKGQWDAKSVETPSVVKFKDTYYLFYTGYDGKQHDVQGYEIGYATSKDGISWQKQGDAPLLKPTKPYAWFPNMDFNQYIVAEPGAAVLNGKLYLYFTALGGDKETNTALQTIGVVTSDDGVTWSAPRLALRPEQRYYPRANNYKGFSTPSATAVNGQMHLFVDVTTEEPFSQISLTHAISADGLTGWQQQPSPFFRKEQFAWTSNQIRSPNMVQVGDSYHLWFAGDDGQKLGIGYAVCTPK